MLLTITLTQLPATDLGYLLAKHPGRAQSFTLSFGQAHVFYPEATDQRCTAALLLDIDPVSLSRAPRGAHRPLEPYVNDRPYVASSFLSVAIAQVFRSALSGICNQRPELVDMRLPLSATLAVVPCRGGEEMLRRLFEPLGYRLTARQQPLDERFPDWGESRYFTVDIEGTVRLRDLLSHIYVLIPVLDDEKHYWVGDDEVAKLLRRGEGWLEAHPARNLITERYLKHRHSLARAALAQLADDSESESDAPPAAQAGEETLMERTLSLHEQRLGAAMAALKQSGAHRVLDLGCGEGRLLERLMADHWFTEIVGMDASVRALESAEERLHLDRLPSRQTGRLRLLHGALTYRDERLSGFDAAAVVEVIEHLDPARLAAFERVLFEHARPATVVLTTPNAEYNVKWPTLPIGKLRHRDHRFEWTRGQFHAWADAVAQRFDYGVRFLPLGPEDEAVGAPSQMAIFDRRASEPT
jgi:3' terminal RNA ribose 2'-O-methyltransferase Hen1